MTAPTITVRFLDSSNNYTFFVTDHIAQEYIISKELLIGMCFKIQTTSGVDYDNHTVCLIDYDLCAKTNEKYATICKISDISWSLKVTNFYIDVTFPTSDKIYRYKIPGNEYNKLKDSYKVGDKLLLTTNTGSNFQGTEVSLVKVFEGIYDIPCRSTIISNIEVVSNEDNQMPLNSIRISADDIDADVTIENITIKDINTNNTLITIEEKGKKEMKLFGNIEFGKYTQGNIKFSIKGLAYRTDSNKFITFDAENQEFTDVSDFILDLDVKQFLYKIPVAIADVAPGDVILNDGQPVFVVSAAGTKIEIISPADKEVKTILAPKNVFGFNYMTKLVDLTNGAFSNAAGASEDTPFGNSLLPLLFMTEGNADNILPFLLLNNKDGFNQNALMLFALANDKESNKDMLPLLFAINGGFDLFGKNDEKKTN